MKQALRLQTQTRDSREYRVGDWRVIVVFPKSLLTIITYKQAKLVDSARDARGLYTVHSTQPVGAREEGEVGRRPVGLDGTVL